MVQMSAQTSEPTAGQDMQQHAKPSLTSEILIVQSIDLRWKEEELQG